MKLGWFYIFFALVSVVLVSACVQPNSIKHDQRISGTGYSASPPEGASWRLIHNEQDKLVFGKWLTDAEIPYQSFVAVVSTMNTLYEAMHAANAADFRSAVESFLYRSLNTERFSILSLETAPHGLRGQYCASYSLIQEERGNQFAPKLVLEIAAHGFMCLDSSRQFVVHTFYSERKARGQESVLTGKLKLEGEQFLKSVEVDPYRERGSGI